METIMEYHCTKCKSICTRCECEINSLKAEIDELKRIITNLTGNEIIDKSVISRLLVQTQ